MVGEKTPTRITEGNVLFEISGGVIEVLKKQSDFIGRKSS